MKKKENNKNYQDISITKNMRQAYSANEPAVQYRTAKRGKVIALTGISNKPEHKLTSIEKMKFAKEGVEKRELESLKAVTDLDYDNLAKALSVTRATLINKKKS
jgi:hypothetical protein